MVDVGMRQNDVVNFRGIHTKIAVHGIGFKPFTLINPAVKQYLFPGFGGNQVPASGYLPGSA
jgi:competence transcription factor ComK